MEGLRRIMERSEDIRGKEKKASKEEGREKRKGKEVG